MYVYVSSTCNCKMLFSVRGRGSKKARLTFHDQLKKKKNLFWVVPCLKLAKGREGVVPDNSALAVAL